MELRHLFVHLDSTPVRARRVALALGLARRFNAHVSALFAQVDGVVPTYGLPEGLPLTTQATGAHVIDRFAAEARAVGVSFDAAVAPPGGAAEVINATLEGARDSDLALLGACQEVYAHGEVPPDLIAQVIQWCGRPVLLVPCHGQAETLGRRVLVGWNGTREAARALNDALPLMRHAEAVYLLSIAPPSEIAAELAPSTGGVVRHLRRHGIEATLVREPRHALSVADTLVSRVTDFGCDLLVLGAFGHLSLPAWLRQGVTRPLVGQSTVPTLLSH
ncbi:universal stress protein [Pararhodospirillum oryzae]|uniref:Universal stress protein UspA n=1 Tax=Pararhodospirillum oryzae TaxID=478448 RepID=A0A512H4D3_9PROT|nr:universal stress protein [Pararhodospirillum oryzae]GEO80325.1 universal stress protein UspA [Pararhodospirillum oryzae]